MSQEIRITFNPAGFAECLSQFDSTAVEEAEKIAARASSMTDKGGFHVELEHEPKFQDSAYGVTRPVAYVVANDDETTAEETENKILSKAVM